jgi:hypothetical protein
MRTMAWRLPSGNTPPAVGVTGAPGYGAARVIPFLNWLIRAWIGWGKPGDRLVISAVSIEKFLKWGAVPLAPCLKALPKAN